MAPHLVGYFVVALGSALLGLVVASAAAGPSARLNSSMAPRIVVVPLIPGDLPDEPPMDDPDDEENTEFELDMRACRLAIAAALEGRCDAARKELKSCRGHMRSTAKANVERCGD